MQENREKHYLFKMMKVGQILLVNLSFNWRLESAYCPPDNMCNESQLDFIAKT